MGERELIKVYGREEVCASCVGAPSSEETFEWLQAAISRKYDAEHFKYKYIDMDQTVEKSELAFIKQMVEEDWLYPVITLNGEVIAEGIPNIKKIHRAIDQLKA